MTPRRKLELATERAAMEMADLAHEIEGAPVPTFILLGTKTTACAAYVGTDQSELVRMLKAYLRLLEHNQLKEIAPS